MGLFYCSQAQTMHHTTFELSFNIPRDILQVSHLEDDLPSQYLDWYKTLKANHNDNQV